MKDDEILGGEFALNMGTIANQDIESPEYKKKLEDHLKSDDFFNKKRFDQFKGILGFHPVGVIYAYTLKYPGMPVLADAVLEMIKVVRNTRRGQLTES
jgi:hypothetical protein